MSNNLISDETIEAYKNRLEKMQIYKDSAEGDHLFISKVVAVSEQIENLQVKAKVGNFEVENDGPKDLGGSGEIPGPMPMFLASIANCLEITALLYLSYSNIYINSIRVEVQADYDKRSALNPKKEPFPGFHNFNITWYLDTEENPNRIERILKKVEDICPVRGTLTRINTIHQKIEIIN